MIKFHPCGSKPQSQVMMLYSPDFTKKKISCVLIHLLIEKTSGLSSGSYAPKGIFSFFRFSQISAALFKDVSVQDKRCSRTLLLQCGYKYSFHFYLSCVLRSKGFDSYCRIIFYVVSFERALTVYDIMTHDSMI